VMQRQKDERIEWNGMWGEFGPVPTHASSSWARTSFCAQPLAPLRGRRYGSGRVGSAEDSSLERPTRPSRPVFAGGGRGGSSIFSNRLFRVFEPLDQPQVPVISNPSRTAGFQEIIDGFVVGFLALGMNDENRNYIYWNNQGFDFLITGIIYIRTWHLTSWEPRLSFLATGLIPVEVWEIGTGSTNNPTLVLTWPYLLVSWLDIW
jgi:hypothetical protein